MSTLYVGCDISAQDVHVHWYLPDTQQRGQWVISQSQSGYQRLVGSLCQLCPDPSAIHLVMEATANYGLALALFVEEAGLTVSVINPLQGKRFAQLHLRRAKTDPIDARMLCDLAHTLKPARWTPAPPIYYQLQQRLALREDLVTTRTQFRNRLHAMRHHPHAEAPLQALLQQQIDQLSQQIKQLTRAIGQLLASDHQWHAASRHLLTIPGLGVITTAWILTATHCFARCPTAEQAAAYAGLLPHPRQSGQSKRKAQTGGGNQTLRSLLYLAAGSALQHNRPLKAFYQKLVQAGKLKNVARVAVAPKLMHIAWACVVKERDFDPHFGQPARVA